MKTSEINEPRVSPMGIPTSKGKSKNFSSNLQKLDDQQRFRSRKNSEITSWGVWVATSSSPICCMVGALGMWGKRPTTSKQVREELGGGTTSFIFETREEEFWIENWGVKSTWSLKPSVQEFGQAVSGWRNVGNHWSHGVPSLWTLGSP